VYVFVCTLRIRYLGGLHAFVTIITAACTEELPALLHGLGSVVRDEETSVREAAQNVCLLIGLHVKFEDVWELLLPKARGLVPGGDTAAASTCLPPIYSRTYSHFVNACVRVCVCVCAQ
jgi:hypothetical protein